MNQDKIKMRGKIKEVIRGGEFKVTLENGIEITAQVSGKMRVNRISILPGDEVEVELSPYDLVKGRIVYRHH